MKISKKDALVWFRFFASLPEEELLPRQQELALAVMAQIESGVEARREVLLREIPGLKSLRERTLYVGPEEKFPRGCRSCLLGTGLSAIRRTNRCNLNCPFCYNYGQLDQIPPMPHSPSPMGGI